MSEESQPAQAGARPPSAQQLLAHAERLKSQALYVGTTRLIQESRHLRESTERAREEADRRRPTSSQPKSRSIT